MVHQCAQFVTSSSSGRTQSKMNGNRSSAKVVETTVQSCIIRDTPNTNSNWPTYSLLPFVSTVLDATFHGFCSEDFLLRGGLTLTP